MLMVENHCDSSFRIVHVVLAGEACGWHFRVNPSVGLVAAERENNKLETLSSCAS